MEYGIYRVEVRGPVRACNGAEWAATIDWKMSNFHVFEPNNGISKA